MLKAIKQWIHRFKTKDNCIFGKKVTIDSRCVFEGGNRLAYGVTALNTRLGYGSYIGDNSFIKNTLIGRYTCIASDVITVPGSHPTKSFVSIHPAFYSVMKQAGFTYVTENKYEDFNYIDKDNRISVIIGNDVWIGEGVRILEGVKIGDGAVVATGAIVTKDVEPYAIVGGVPAKMIRYRFEQAEIEQLLQLAWWNKGNEWINQHAQQFENIRVFLKENSQR